MDPVMKNILKLASNFRLNISNLSTNDRLQKNLQMNMPTEQTYKGDSSLSLESDEDRGPLINPLTKKGSRPFELESIRSPTKTERDFNSPQKSIFRNLKTKIEKTLLLKRSPLSGTQLMLNRIAVKEGRDEEGGNAGVFSEYWEIFKDIVNKSKKIMKVK